MFSQSMFDGMTAEVLWEGNFTEGALTLHNAADVDFIIINTVYNIPCFGGFVGGIGGYYGGNDPNYMSYRFAVTTSGNDVTLATDSVYNKGVVDANVNQTIGITKIIGIRAKKGA